MLWAKSDTRKKTGIVLFLVGLLPPLSVAEQVRRRPKLVMDEGGLLHYYWGRRFKIDRGGPIPRGIADCNANGAERRRRRAATKTPVPANAFIFTQLDLRIDFLN